jgi:glycosyl hydrolase family 115 (putative glucuronidase)
MRTPLGNLGSGRKGCGPSCFNSLGTFAHMSAKVLAIAFLICGWSISVCAASQTSVKGSRTTKVDNRAHGTIVLNSAVTIFITPDAAEPIQMAADDLAADFQTVFGTRPKIVHRREDAGPTTILVAESSNLPSEIRATGLTAPESFSISTQAVGWSAKHSTKVVLLSGTDMRGTVYSVYQFSQNYLAIDPLYYWTDNLPVHRNSIAIPANLNDEFSPPVFTYRGFFINDEDLLTGWAPGEDRDKTGISLDVWNRIYETILRLKGNMVAPGTWIFPDDAQVKLAAKRGLIIAQHHAIPLGLNVARWPKDAPYDYSEHPEILEHAWRKAVNSYLPNQEVLWTVGLRGLSDVTYASMDPHVRDNNSALGALISKAIADQMQIVRSVHPDAKFITNLWQEEQNSYSRAISKFRPRFLSCGLTTGAVICKITAKFQRGRASMIMWR